RRHQCEICDQVFECHLCGISEEGTHVLHRENATKYSVICEDCIETHQLYVRIIAHLELRHSFDPLKNLNYSYENRTPGKEFGTSFRFYDHLTGKLLGRGGYRRA